MHNFCFLSTSVPAVAQSSAAATAIGKNSRFIAVRVLMDIYTSVVRGTPLLLQLFFVYYGLPLLIPGLRFERFNAAALTFVINYGSYFTEIFRGGIQSIEKGQYEASKVLGMNYRQTMIRIIIPQIIITAAMTPTI